MLYRLKVGLILKKKYGNKKFFITVFFYYLCIMIYVTIMYWDDKHDVVYAGTDYDLAHQRARDNYSINKHLAYIEHWKPQGFCYNRERILFQ